MARELQSLEGWVGLISGSSSSCAFTYPGGHRDAMAAGLAGEGYLLREP